MDTRMAETFRNATADLMPTPIITQPADATMSLEHPVCQPVVIGNISGANLLTRAIMNKQEISPATLSAGHVIGREFVNILPLNPQQPVTDQLNQLQNHCTSVTTSSACSSGWFQDLDKHKTSELKNKSCASSTKVLVSENCRVQLASSDTIILSQESLSVFHTLPIASLFMPNDSNVEESMAKDKSPLPGTSKPFSLLTNISDRSVSLESIPSSGLFQLDHEHASNISLYKSNYEETTLGSSKAVSEQTLAEITDSQFTNETTVLGSNRIPESIIHLMEHLKHMKSPDQQICLLTSPENAHSNKSMPDQDSCDPSCNLSISNPKGTAEEGNSDTDTEIQPEAIPVVNNKENDLSRSDTVILNVSKDNSVACSSSDLRSDDTFILACDDKQVPSNERSSEGFSFTSVNSFGPSSLELQINEPLINKLPSVLCNSLINQSSETLPVLTLQSDHMNKSLYVVTNEGYLAAVRYVSPDPLEVSQLVQLGLFNNVDANHPVFNPSVPEAHSRNVEVKETQTELVFGTNTLQFKLVDAVQDNSTCSVEQLSNLVFAKSLPEKTSFIPSVIVIKNHARPPDQPHSSDKVQGPVISLAEPTGNEKIASNNQMTVHQLTECGTTPLQTSEPGLPDTSHADGCAEFKCMECQDTFKTKHDLVSHGKIHKRGFKCDLCNATFTRIGNFTRHKKIHKLETESQNVFKCSDCGREFLQRCDLKRHLLIHAKQEPHRCDKCGKGYIRRSDLVVHMRFHNKDKAFKCSMCDKKFFQSGDLSRHVRRAHMPNSHLTCGHCNRKYACESTLIRHMKAAHKDIILSTVNVVNETLQESNSSGKSPSVNTKDVVFTMTKRPERKH